MAAVRWSSIEVKTALLVASLVGVFAYSAFEFEQMRQNVERSAVSVQVSTARMATLGQLLVATGDPAMTAPDKLTGLDENGKFRAQLVALDRARTALEALLPTYQYDGATYARLARYLDSVGGELAALRRAGVRPGAAPGGTAAPDFDGIAVAQLAAELMTAEQDRGQGAAVTVMRAIDAAAKTWLITFFAVGFAALAFAFMAIRQIRAWRQRANRKPAEIHLQLQHDAADQVALNSGIANSISTSLNNSRTIGVMAITLEELPELRRRTGADAVEMLVVEVAKRLRAMFRPTDLMARVDGDTIVVVLPDIRVRDDMNVLSRRVRESINGVSVAELNGARLTPDIGMAMYPIDGYSGEELIAAARASLAKGKRSDPDATSQAA
jgi:diguanylate cyclase (GGDEF)-like protein